MSEIIKEEIEILKKILAELKKINSNTSNTKKSIDALRGL